MGDHSEMYQLDAPKPGQNPTMWDVRDTDTKPKNLSYPTNIVFKENPGGEYRKSFHGYPHGYAQLLHSPKNFVCEPMQIDTHNRKYKATDAVGYHPSFLPKSMDKASGENLGSGLSPLIECPCSTRITRSTKNSSAILTSSKCPKLIKTQKDCEDAIARVAPVSSSISVSNESMAYGCTMRPDTQGGYVAIYNAANTSHTCGSATTARGPFTWAAPKKNSGIDCGGKGAAPCLPPSAKAGCAGKGTQCVWESVAAAEKGCASYEQCEAFFCSTRYEAETYKFCKKGEKCPLLCFGRTNAVATASTGDTVYAKHYTNPQPEQYLEGASLESLHGASLVNVSLSHDGTTAEITLTGPAKNWFGVGFNAQNMAALPYAIIVGGDGTVTERKLGSHAPGSQLPSSLTVKSSSTIDGMRKVVVSRPVAAKTKDHWAIATVPGQINLITAVGDTPQLAYHKARTGALITLLPSKVDSCLCAPVTTDYLTYMNSSTAAFNYDCVEEPRGDMAHAQRDIEGKLIYDGKMMNPACKYNTYHGGLQCCHHLWYLTDYEQNSSIPDEVDIYYLKWRFYFQEYTPPKPATPPFPVQPASHQHLHHWVFLIDAQVNDYEEVRCETGGLCQGTITAHLQAKDMGLEDIPGTKNAVGEPSGAIADNSFGGQMAHKQNFTGMNFFVMTPHCHAPSCLRQELWNNDTGELICRVIPHYGTGVEVFNEVNYIAIPPCIWGHQEGLLPPPQLHPDTNLTAIKYFNNTFRHMGQMAQWTGLMTYDGVPGGNDY